MQTAEAVDLRTTISPPYQIMLQGELSGVSANVIRCILGDMDEAYAVQVMPWGRAVADIISAEADGLFTSMPSAELDNYAIMSVPFALEKWYWYFTDSKLASRVDFRRGLRIGAIRSSNQALWLKINGYTQIEEVNEGGQLLQLVRAGRLDTFIADEKNFHEIAFELDINESDFKRQFLKYTPLGIYFANHFLSGRPDFLANFNARVSACAPGSMVLTDDEIKKLKAILEYHIRNWVDSREVISSVRMQNESMREVTIKDIEVLDKQWRSEVASKERPSINKLLNNPLSKYLRDVQEASKGLYTEIFVVDRNGLNVGQSKSTSDYYQGDEKSFQKSFGQGVGGTNIGGIEYDDSTRTFQVKVSLTIGDEYKTPIGAVIVGIDVERALSAD
jgi:ABC-type amino acid transport substrate-binding protein